MNDDEKAVLAALFVLFASVIYFVPTIIAFARKHHYRWVIFAINLVTGVTILGLLVSLVWAVWPNQTALTDPFYGDPVSSDVEAGKRIYEKRGEYNRSHEDGEQWFFAINGKTDGPVSRRDLIAKVTRGEVGQSDLVWREGMPEWRPVQTALRVPRI